jgi:hypothetical protein
MSSQKITPGGLPLIKVTLSFALALFLIHLLTYALEINFSRGSLADPDAYMWLQRVESLHQHGQWFDQTSPRSNTPYGEIQHWSRPFDVLLYAGASLLSPLCDFSTALYYWGICISPLLHCLSLFLILLAARQLRINRALPWIPVFFIVQACMIVQFQVGRPDHQSLLLAVFTFSLTPAFRLFQNPEKTTQAIWLGFSSALLLWISVESLIQIGLVYGVLFMGWIIGRSHSTDALLRYSLALCCGLTTALFLEAPASHFLTSSYDKLSFIHLFLIGLISLSTLLLQTLEPWLRGGLSRFLTLAMAASACLLTLHCYFPDFLYGPFSSVDPAVNQIWLSRVAELQPLIDGSGIKWLDIFVLLGSCLVALIALFIYLRHSENSERISLLFLCLGIGLYVFLALFHQYRWAAYAELLSVIPLSMTMVGLVNLICRHFPRFPVPMIRVGSLLLLSLGPTVLGLFIFCLSDLGGRHASAPSLLSPATLGENSSTGMIYRRKKEIPFHQLLDFMESGSLFAGKTLDVMTFINLGPEILYRTRHHVVSTPYHRNTEGILDEYLFFTSSDKQVSLDLGLKRGIDLVIISPDYLEEKNYYSWPEHPESLYAQLAHGNPPSWLSVVELPSDLKPFFRVFEFKPGQKH